MGVVKNIVVTGHRSGLGKAIFERLELDGFNVVGFDLKDGFDVCQPGRLPKPQFTSIPSFCEGDDEKTQVLINCAGINLNQWFEEVDFASFTEVMDTNAFSFVSMTQWLLDDLKTSKGCVINIVSNAANIPMTSSLAYNASKAAGLMITKQMAHELTPKYGITVFSISPNKLRGTEMSKKIEDNVCKVRGWTPEYAAEYQKKALMHGLETEPDNIASLISHLLLSGSYKFMSGTDLPFGK